MVKIFPIASIIIGQGGQMKGHAGRSTEISNRRRTASQLYVKVANNCAITLAAFLCLQSASMAEWLQSLFGLRMNQGSNPGSAICLE